MLQFEEVYKSALGCFVNGAERLVSEHGDLADQYLRKASVCSLHACARTVNDAYKRTPMGDLLLYGVQLLVAVYACAGVQAVYCETPGVAEAGTAGAGAC